MAQEKLFWKKFCVIMTSILIGSGFIWFNSVKLYKEQDAGININITKAKEAQDKTDCLKVLIGTKMEDAIPEIKKSAEYYDLPEELFLGIAFAESSFKHFKCFNPWGIDTGRGNYPRCYKNWEHSINGFALLIKFSYFNEGKFTAEQLCRKYVGYHNEKWIRNVKTYYSPEIIIKQ
jgi:hypothetical protein